MLGLTRLLVSTSATLGGAATLLIRFCTLWFGLGLGVIALLIFRSTQYTIEEKQKGQKQETDSTLPVDEHQSGLRLASTSASTGEKAI